MVLTRLFHLFVELYVISVMLTAAFHSFSYFRSAYFTKPSNSIAFKIGTYKDRLANKLFDQRPLHLYSFERRTLFRLVCGFVVFVFLVLSDADAEWVMVYTLALCVQSITAIVVSTGVRSRIYKLRETLKSNSVQR